MKNFSDSNGIPLIVNNDVDLCARLNASGVHLGQSDGDPIRTRAILGADKIIGLTVNTTEQIGNSNLLPIDYIGVGVVFPITNKFDVTFGAPVSGVSPVVCRPIIAIGGIDEDNALSVMRAGGIAAIGVFHNAKDPYLTA